MLTSLYYYLFVSVEDKQQIFRSFAKLWGHRIDIISDDQSVTMRLKQCGIYENLKKAGRTDVHDCRKVCKCIAPDWFKEIEPRTNGAGSVDLQIPQGGPYCDWTVEQPQ